MSESSKPQLRWIYANIRPDRWRYLLLSLGRASETLLYIADAFLARALIDGAVAGDRSAILRNGLWLLLLALVSVGASIGLTRLSHHLERRWNIRLRTRLFQALLQKDYAATSAFHSGALLDRLYTDVSTVNSGAVDLLPDLLSMATGLVGSIAALYWLDARLPLVVLAACLAFAVLARLFKGFVGRYHKRMRNAEGEARAYYQESLENLLILKIFRGRKPAARRADYYERNAYDAWSKWYRRKQFVSGGVELFFSLGRLITMVVCALLIFAGTLTYGSMVAILQLVAQVQSPFSEISSEIALYATMLSSADRLIELEALPAAEDDDAIDAVEAYARLRSIDGRGLTFRYDDDGREVLLDADATIRKGEFVVLSGESGVGKSTLLKLMLGVYAPESGTLALTMDDGASIPLGTATRSLFAYVPQGNLLFSGTIRDNLTFLCGERSDEQLAEALRLSCADRFISELPDGLDTKLGESGRGLSEGQAQRLSIARALLCDAPILLLDEATSALDVETETQLLQNLRALRNCTLLIVSHKQAARDVCDRELTLRSGALLERSIRP